MNFSRRQFPAFVLAVFSAVLLAGCGRQEPESTSAKTSAAPVAKAAVPPDITVLAGDDMKFSVTRIEAAPGEAINLTLTNNGRMPKNAMGHNWVLLTKDADARAYCMAAMSAIGSDYLPPAQADKVLAHTSLLGPGESVTINFNAPAEPGNYPFVCSFPGHFLSGMGGVLVVKAAP
ncbi:MAG: plastocyanin/azurin family copper-binding protein [Verrucomicrobiota bacterium]